MPIKRNVNKATSISKVSYSICHTAKGLQCKPRSHLPVGHVQSLANIGLSDLKNFLRKCKPVYLKKPKISCRLFSLYHGFLIGKTSATREKMLKKSKGNTQVKSILFKNDSYLIKDKSISNKTKMARQQMFPQDSRIHFLPCSIGIYLRVNV